MNDANFLPIGTVCRLKDGQKNIMIIGFCPITEETEQKMYDYSGCVYPEGVLSSDLNLLFNHNQIEEIIYKGYEDEDDLIFKEKLNEMIKNEINAFKDYKPPIIMNVEKNESIVQNEVSEPQISIPNNQTSSVVESSVAQTTVENQPTQISNTNPIDLFSTLPSQPSINDFMNNN